MATFVSKQIGKIPERERRASDYEIGASVYIPVNNVNTEFLIVHQGKPSSIYSSTFDNGTILLMKDCYGENAWSYGSNDYENSAINSLLNGTFLSLFSSYIKSVIKQVKIPYRKGSGSSTVVTSGEEGLSTKIFLLSLTEIGLSISYAPINEGAKLDYFESGSGTSAKNKRIAKYNGNNRNWWVRSPQCYDGSVWHIQSNGSTTDGSPGNIRAYRPAFVIPNTTEFDPNTNVIL